MPLSHRERQRLTAAAVRAAAQLKMPLDRRQVYISEYVEAMEDLNDRITERLEKLESTVAETALDVAGDGDAVTTQKWVDSIVGQVKEAAEAATNLLSEIAHAGIAAEASEAIRDILGHYADSVRAAAAGSPGSDG